MQCTASGGLTPESEMPAGRLCRMLADNAEISHGRGSGSARVLLFPLLILQGGRLVAMDNHECRE